MRACQEFVRYLIKKNYLHFQRSWLGYHNPRWPWTVSPRWLAPKILIQGIRQGQSWLGCIHWVIFSLDPHSDFTLDSGIWANPSGSADVALTRDKIRLVFCFKSKVTPTWYLDLKSYLAFLRSDADALTDYISTAPCSYNQKHLSNNLQWGLLMEEDLINHHSQSDLLLDLSIGHPSMIPCHTKRHIYPL